MALHPAHVRAVAEIQNTLPREQGGHSAPYAPRHARGLAQLEGYLRRGSETGRCAVSRWM